MAVKKNKTTVQRSGRKYQIAANFKSDDLGPQEKVIYSVLSRRTNGASARELADSCAAQLKKDGAKQDAIRIVSFYLSKWKGANKIKVVKAEAKAKKAKAARKAPATTEAVAA